MSASALECRLRALPFNTARVRSHIDAGRVKIGDYLQRYDSLMQARVLSRPAGREYLDRGDAGCYVAASGARYSWAVAAVDGDTALINVSSHDGGAGALRVAWDMASRAPLGAPDEYAELFSAVSEAEAWPRERHRLDLWDWVPGQPLAAEGPGAQVSARPSGGAWLVETPHGDFVWTPARGKNLVTPASGALPAQAYLASLFVRPPERAD